VSAAGHGSCLVRRGWAGTMRVAGLAWLGCWREAGPSGKGWAGALAAVLGRGKKMAMGRMRGRGGMEGISLFLFINKIFKLIFKRFLESFSI